MALGWFSLLKTVPWAEVIATAPVVADGAKKLWKTVSKKPVMAPAPASVVLATESDLLSQLQARVATLEATAAELHAQMQASTGLIQALASQNAELVRRVEANRVRLRWVSAGLVLLALVFAYTLKTGF